MKYWKKSIKMVENLLVLPYLISPIDYSVGHSKMVYYCGGIIIERYLDCKNIQKSFILHLNIIIENCTILSGLSTIPKNFKSDFYCFIAFLMSA